MLKFSTLEELVRFSKLLPGGYLLNTITLTITTSISEVQWQQAINYHQTGSLLNANQQISTAA